jgi:hypothetical protein
MRVEADGNDAAVDTSLAHMSALHSGEPPPSPEQVRQGFVATAHLV